MSGTSTAAKMPAKIKVGPWIFSDSVISELVSNLTKFPEFPVFFLISKTISFYLIAIA